MKIFLKVLMMVGLLVQSGDLFAAAAQQEEGGPVQPMNQVFCRFALPPEIVVQKNHRYFQDKNQLFGVNGGYGCGYFSIDSIIGMRGEVESTISDFAKLAIAFKPQTVKETCTGLSGSLSDSFGTREVYANRMVYEENKVGLVVPSSFLDQQTKAGCAVLTVSGTCVKWTIGQYQDEPKQHFEVKIDLKERTYSTRLSHEYRAITSRRPALGAFSTPVQF